MQVIFLDSSGTAPVECELDAVPRSGDFVVLADGQRRRVDRVEWDLREQQEHSPLFTRVVRVHCAQG